MLNIKLSERQVQYLIDFLDTAVKARGLEIAGMAYDIAVELQAALEGENNEPGTDSTDT